MKTLTLIAATGWLSLGTSIAAAQSHYAEPQRTGAQRVQSEFREGIEVEFLYREDLEGVYWTTWYARVEKREGLWLDIYYETAEKAVTKGILSFQCFAVDNDGDRRIGIVDYSMGEFGDLGSARLTRVPFEKREAWMTRSTEEFQGYSPPYELFVIAHYRFCDAENSVPSEG